MNLKRKNRKSRSVFLFSMFLFWSVLPDLCPAAAPFTVTADFPGGNVVVENKQGDTVTLRPALRDTSTWWFYWNFRVLGAEGRTVTFQFSGRNPIGVLGPAVCTNVNHRDGELWRWLPESVSGKSFSYTFASGEDKVGFCFAMPYTKRNWDAFVQDYCSDPHCDIQELCRTKKGRSVKRIHVGNLSGSPKYRVLVTCRHHACEMMASYALEGLLSYLLADSEDGEWFRHQAELVAIPFMDLDGVEDGDQGKNRKPHDHNRDYLGNSIYPAVRSLRSFVRSWSQGKLIVALDLHCPWIRGPHNEVIYQVGKRNPAIWKEQTRFGTILEKVRKGPLPYRVSDNLPFGAAWNTGGYTGSRKSFGGWASELPGIALATTFELPYAHAGGKTVTAESARLFGYDLGPALCSYLRQKRPPFSPHSTVSATETGHDHSQVKRIVPGDVLTDPPTLHNLGFRWYVEGDANRNARVLMFYRKKGASKWKRALPLLRVHHEVANKEYEPYRTGNLFAGSVLGLESGTAYEVKLVMEDPDGGAPAPVVLTVSTRTEPIPCKGGRTLHVYPAGSKAKQKKGAITGFTEALKQAKPGDTLLLHAGVYKGPFRVTQSGEPGKPIVIRGRVDGDAILQGPDLKTHLLSIDGCHDLWFESLVLRTALCAIRAGKRHTPGVARLVVRRCRIENVITGIFSYSENSQEWFIADNVLTGTNPTWYPRPNKTYMSPSHTGINLYGRGHVVCYNRIERFSDALAIANFGPPVEDRTKHCVAIDFYNNDLSFAQDDGIEADYGCHNVRVYCNRIMNAHTALSAQPFYGGPCYFIRNTMYSITALPLKLHNWCTGLEIYHNTCLSARQGFQSYSRWQNAKIYNNLFLGAKRYALETGSSTPYTHLDCNGWRRNEEERFLKWFDGKNWGRYHSLDAFYSATGNERHGIEVGYDIFVDTAPAGEGETYAPDAFDVQLCPGSAGVDAGKLLPTINEDFTGAAPDLGCYERGKKEPHYGPR